MHGAPQWVEGSQAARAGLKSKDCPYSPLTYHYVTWHNGWAFTMHQMAKEDDEL